MVTARVYFVLGEEDATVSCTSAKHPSAKAFAVHSFEAYATDELWTDDVRPGQNYTVTCSISDGNTLSATVKVPGGEEVTATGSFTDLGPPVGDRQWTENSVTLNFSTAGGAVTGSGRVVLHDFYIDCDDVTEYEFQGEYSAETGQFTGTVEENWNDQCSTLGLIVWSYTWRATLADGSIEGTIEDQGYVVRTFELTVQS